MGISSDIKQQMIEYILRDKDAISVKALSQRTQS
jgi:hypothetical protein